jgi:very-short-patch-repair endonuclease
MGDECAPDRAVAAIAARQHGVVSRAQLLALGLGRHAIHWRLRSGRLHLLHRGVYAVGHTAVTGHGRWMAAALAGGPDAVLSHHAAAALWRLRDPRGGPVDVTTPRHRRGGRGLRFHQVRLPDGEVTELDGIPVTSMPRTLLDLAAVLDLRALERAINEADYLRLTDALSLPDMLRRYPRRAGTPRLSQALARRTAGATRTRSEMEELFLQLLDAHGLPRPAVNAYVEGIGEVDCLWVRQRVALELDGRRAHDTAAAFERDRERDRRLQARGWRVVRVTWRQMDERPRAVIDDLRHMLGATVSA